MSYDDADVEKGAVALYVLIVAGDRETGTIISPARKEQAERDYLRLRDHQKKTWRMGARAVLDSFNES